jgi:hypothetical protein
MNGGVNPPEAAQALTNDAVEPRTVETPDGGAQPAPGWVESKAGTVVRATTPAPESGAGVPATPSPASSTEGLTRGQKAALTRAANKAKASSGPSGDAPAAAAESSGTAPAGDLALGLAVGTLERIATALEKIAGALEDKPQGFSLLERIAISLERVQ